MSNKKKEIEFNEGFTISENGVERKYVNIMLERFDLISMFSKGGFSFVKVSNLHYESRFNVKITDWVGVVFHSDCGVVREEMEEWLGRYGGDLVNDIGEPREVLSFDFEVIPNEEMMKMYPIIKSILEVV
jgi:hypothetical protein|tara:strand:+ start:57 stop:446 length:390 start_codon:yes stop_codon:yes gene_type:complete